MISLLNYFKTRLKKIVVFILILQFIFVTTSFAQIRYIIDKKLSSIEGSIKYIMIGKYQYNYETFFGTIYYNPKDVTKSSVEFKIMTKSLKSPYPKFDRIIRSKRILDVEKYPEAIFRSKNIIRTKKEGSYIVTGEVIMHGVAKEIKFPIELTIIDNNYIKVEANLILNRKKFNIIWHKVLDKGGIFVGNHTRINCILYAKKQ